jgi:hypothetical protein
MYIKYGELYFRRNEVGIDYYGHPSLKVKDVIEQFETEGMTVLPTALPAYLQSLSKTACRNLFCDFADVNHTVTDAVLKEAIMDKLNSLL